MKWPLVRRSRLEEAEKQIAHERACSAAAMAQARAFLDSAVEADMRNVSFAFAKVRKDYLEDLRKLVDNRISRAMKIEERCMELIKQHRSQMLAKETT